MSAHEVDGRRSTGARCSLLRSTGSDGYTLVGYAIIAAVVLVAVAGAVLLVSMIMSTGSGDGEQAGPAGPSASLAGCTGTLWLDASTGTCVPKATCAEGEVFNGLTNTCSTVPPTVTSITPRSGPVAGGTSVTITGMQIMAGATVTVDREPARDVKVVDDTTITATVPPGLHLYPVDVTVTNPGGEPVSLDNSFTYVAPQEKRLTEVRPPRGSASGGETVIIKGKGLVAGAKVVFNNIPATDVVVVDDATIKVTTPAGALGPVNVNVKNPDEAPFVLAEGFTYVDAPPRIVSAVTPKKGPVAGKTKVVITGSGFASGAKVSFGGVPATGVKIVNDARISAVTPPGPLGRVEVTVRNPGLPAATLAKAFQYVEVPVVSSVKPNKGPEAGGTKVTITGSGFAKGATVTVDGTAAVDVKVVNVTTITAKVPAGVAGPAKVMVAVPGELPATLPKAFTYVAVGTTPTPAPTTPTVLPACVPFVLPDVSTPAGISAILVGNELFPASTGVKGARLTAVIFVGDSDDDSDGSVSWKESPPSILWRTPNEAGKGGTISFSYRASSCTGTGRGSTVRVASP